MSILLICASKIFLRYATLEFYLKGKIKQVVYLC